MYTKEKKVRNIIKAIVFNKRGIFITGGIILFIFYLFTNKDDKIRRILSENFFVIILVIYITLMYLVIFFRSKKVDEIANEKGMAS